MDDTAGKSSLSSLSRRFNFKELSGEMIRMKSYKLFGFLAALVMVSGSMAAQPPARKAQNRA